MVYTVPPALIAAEEIFSTLLRSPNPPNEALYRGILLYRKIIRENITGVLRNVFPLFCQCLDEEDIAKIVDKFIYQHQANQPEFHQIATELLLFIQQQCDISAHDISLIEYEWLMYAVEIDDSKVSMPQKINLKDVKIMDIKITLNPTLKIVSLPFSMVLKDKNKNNETPIENYFSIYRKYDNSIWKKKISASEAYILSNIKNKLTLSALLFIFKKETLLLSWLENNNNDETLSIIFLKS